MFGKSVAMLAALSLAASPALAQASAQPLSIQPALQRSAAPMDDGSRLEGGNILPPILFALIIVGGILLATGVIGDNNHPPRSP
jgi:hypothetical protein